MNKFIEVLPKKKRIVFETQLIQHLRSFKSIFINNAFWIYDSSIVFDFAQFFH